MVAHWIIGVCLVAAAAVPALGEEGPAAHGVKLAKLIEPEQARLRLPETAPKVKVRESFQYYDVDGATLDDLRAQMKRNGTTWNDGNIYAALTSWDIRYHYDITAADGGYRLISVGTQVDITFHMPRLAPSAKTPPELRPFWDSYLTHLQTHESGHRDLAVDIGEEIYQALSALGSSPSKDELDREAQALIKAKFQKLKRVQVEYDAETHHGIKQGAVLQERNLASASAH